ncbi:MAG: hypothetical protein NVSMB9_33410 [Isosphaeraceae bacterium]
MSTIGVLLLAAATAGDGFGYSKPGVGLKKLLRPHVVSHGAPPPGGMMSPGASGCSFGHAGCAGGASCPGGAMGAMGPNGAPGGAGGPGGANGGRRFPNVRSQIFFLDPNGMKIGWQTGGGGGERVYLPAQLTVPARYNFMQGYIYRLKVTDVPNRPGVVLYPTVEVAPSTPATDAYLTHNPIPVQFTPEDFDQVLDGGNFVTKVIYLPDPRYQELAIAGVETLVSTRLEPGVDPILEADKRGTILLIVRLGAIDLEMQGATPVVAPTTGPNMTPGPNMAPGAYNPSGPNMAPGPNVAPGPYNPSGPNMLPGPNMGPGPGPNMAPGSVVRPGPNMILPRGSLPPGAASAPPQPPLTEIVPLDNSAPVTPVPAPALPGVPRSPSPTTPPSAVAPGTPPTPAPAPTTSPSAEAPVAPPTPAPSTPPPPVAPGTPTGDEAPDSPAAAPDGDVPPPDLPKL